MVMNLSPKQTATAAMYEANVELTRTQLRYMHAAWWNVGKRRRAWQGAHRRYWHAVCELQKLEEPS
jgi:hypothetical protein